MHPLTFYILFFRMRIVDCVMQSSAFLSFHRLTGNQVTDVNHVAKFAKFAGSFATLEEALGFFVQDVQTIPGADEADIASDDTDIGFHDLVYFLHALGDEYQFFRIHGSFCIPFGEPPGGSAVLCAAEPAPASLRAHHSRHADLCRRAGSGARV